MRFTESFQQTSRYRSIVHKRIKKQANDSIGWIQSSMCGFCPARKVNEGATKGPFNTDDAQKLKLNTIKKNPTGDQGLDMCSL